MKKETLKALVVLSMLTAAHFVVASIFKMPGVFKYSPAFLIVALAGREYGVWGGAVCGALGDFLSAILFPVGAFMPGITLTAGLIGATYGVFMKRPTVLSISLAVIIENFVLGLFLNSFWLSLIVSTKTYWGLVVARLPQMVIMTALGIPALLLVNRCVPRFKKD